MNLRPGMKVWVGWCPDHLTSVNARRARCSVGTIEQGPFPKGTLKAHHVGFVVNIDGLLYDVAEYLLRPFDDDIEVESDEAEATA